VSSLVSTRCIRVGAIQLEGLSCVCVCVCVHAYGRLIASRRTSSSLHALYQREGRGAACPRACARVRCGAAARVCVRAGVVELISPGLNVPVRLGALGQREGRGGACPGRHASACAHACGNGSNIPTNPGPHNRPTRGHRMRLSCVHVRARACARACAMRGLIDYPVERPRSMHALNSARASKE
jgi:hypothetical protein